MGENLSESSGHIEFIADNDGGYSVCVQKSQPLESVAVKIFHLMFFHF